MAFIYNLTDNWTDVNTTWNGIKLAVTNTSSDASSKLLNLTVTGATTASFVVDKNGNLSLNGTVNKVTFTAPATGATLTLADNSTFATSGAHSTTLTTTGTTTLTLPTSGTVTALGNTTTGSGSIVLSNSPALVTPDLGTPSAATLTNATGLPVSTGISGFGTGVAAALGVNVSSAGAFVVNGGALGTPSSGTLTNCTGYTVGNISGLGSGVATWLATPSSANLAAAVTDETGTGSLVFANSPTLVTPNLGTPSAATLTNATGLPISTGVSGLGAGIATFLATPSSANLAAAVTDETGTGSLVFSNSPTFDDDITLGVASSTRGELILANTTANTVKLRSSNSTAASYTLTFPAAAPVNGYYLQTDVNGVLSWAAGGGGGGGSPGGSNTQIQFNNAGVFGGDAAFTFVNGAGTATTTLGVASTTSGALKLYNSASANSVTLASGNNTAAWTLTLPTDDGTNGQLLQTDGNGNLSWFTDTATGDVVGPASSTDNAVVRFDGTTGKLVQNSAVTIADTTGDITGGKYNGLTISTTTGTFTIANGKTLAVDNTLTFVGTDSSTVSFGAGGTVAYTGGTLAQFASTTSAQLAGVISDETGSGSLVFATSPSLTTPTLGVASATSINKVAITAPATSATLTIADGKTFTANNTITLAATNDGQTYTLPAATCNIGYLDVPQNSQSAAYTAVLADSGKHIFHPASDNNARTFTIPANSSVPYPVGTVLTFVNRINTVTIAITSDTMYLAGAGTTGSRTLAANGVATAIKIASTEWIISGTGLT